MRYGRYFSRSNAAMNRSAIPDHGHGRRVRLPNLPQTSPHVLAMIAAVLDVIVQVAGFRDQAHHREMTISIPIAQHRRLPFPRLGQADAGDQIARGFIRIPDHARGAIRRFIPGKRVVVHVVTSASFWRWSFRTVFCRLKPKSRRTCPRLDTSYVTPNSCSISRRTRLRVQRSPSNPWTGAPWSSNVPHRSRCVSFPDS